jgi:hypothetical protein
LPVYLEQVGSFKKNVGDRLVIHGRDKGKSD